MSHYSEYIIFLGIFFTFGVLFFFFWFFQKQKIIQKQLQDQFKSLSLDVMKQSNESFLCLAKEVFDRYKQGSEKDLETKKKEIASLMKPLEQTLEKLDEQNRNIERKREGAYVSLGKQIDQLIHSERNLTSETANLVKALKSPNIRGSWGQVHLRRVIELAGLLNRCDFYEQQSETLEGKTLRPDLIVRLPGERQIIIDAKVPLEAYLDAVETEIEPVKEKRLQDHAMHVRKHVKDLASKEYWKQFQPTPEYVILFLPAEAFLSAALQVDPKIIEIGMDKNVIVATPTTLIAVLKAVAFGWRQETISKNAEKISLLGRELYERLFVMNDHFIKLGKSLSQSIDAYNQTLSSLEARVFVSARKLKDSTVSKPLQEIDPIDKTPKSLLK